jgi:hypothetical protein
MRHWTPEERARQAELIRTWRPWEKSTGPQSEAGKMRSSQNALVHGACTNEVREQVRKMSELTELLRELRNNARSLNQE